ncbi:hypothetical protein [Rugosimonospora africana]|uniref:PH domain-containing protein n=1 Tax=Rugosimonospora africana TaxID=556532 RepID=A0A8J3VRW6_9ACTN|nr:hypothetical protein [Rugosimonospora africana]GIH16524.1 hypothetical protein Raf01_46960 [Rugosimonospora africana]
MRRSAGVVPADRRACTRHWIIAATALIGARNGEVFVELHRNPRLLSTVTSVLLLAAVTGALDVWFLGDRWAHAAVVTAAFPVAVWGPWIVRALWPFRFVVGTDGLTVRFRGANLRLPWSEIHAVVLDDPVRRDRAPLWDELLLVPVDGAVLTAGAIRRSPVDGRPCQLLLKSSDVRESAEDVARALIRFGGDRVVNLADLRRRELRTEFRLLRFGIGYEPYHVQVLVRRAHEALDAGAGPWRQAARAEIESARLPRFWQGYSRREVDATLRALSDALSR